MAKKTNTPETTGPHGGLDLGVEIPHEARNVNTVRDGAARLRETIRLMGSDSWQAQKKRRQLRSWIAHALAPKGQEQAAALAVLYPKGES